MENKYDFLKPYVGHNDLKGIYFMTVSNTEIEEAECIIKTQFPLEIKEFYKEIGCGTLCCGYKYPEMYHNISNLILPPITVAHFSRGILEFDGQDFYMSESAFEDLHPGDLPFFEIHSSEYFLLMKLNSDNPNAVWDGKTKITDSFEEFVYRLYYESPIFYEQYM